MAFSCFSHNGQVLPMERAKVSFLNIEYAYGFGVYENIRVIRGKPLFLDDHLERLRASCDAIGLQHSFEHRTIAAWVQSLIGRIDAPAFNLKMLLVGAPDPADATLSILPLAPKFPDRRLYTRGGTAITVQYERQFPQAKTLNMLGSYLAFARAQAAGAQDAILIDRNHCITEGTRMNILVFKDGRILSPPPSAILPGVTLKHILTVAKGVGMPTVHEPIPLASMRSWGGCCLTSTSSKIMPLRRIDDVELKIPEQMRVLMRKFEEYVRECEK